MQRSQLSPAPPVCNRCRQRKQKCDVNLEGCKSCRLANVECSYHDTVKQALLPRIYAYRLQQQCAALKEQIRNARPSVQRRSAEPRIADNREPQESSRYLGISSGMVFAQLVIERARDLKILDNDEPDLPQETDSTHESLLTMLLPPPTLSIPPRGAVNQAFKIYAETQPQYLVLQEFAFQQHVERFYSEDSSSTPQDRFIVLIIFAISTFFIGRQSRDSAAITLAENYYSMALNYSSSILCQRNISALQAVLLILQYSLINPQESSVWHLLGFAIRLCVCLGLHSEEKLSRRGLDAATLQHWRHLFWCAYSMDRAVGNTLGRPTGLQDRNITTALPSVSFDEVSPTPSSIAVTIHGYKIRQLQGIAADVLYQRSIPYHEGFIAETRKKLDDWLASAPISSSNDFSRDWLLHAFHNLNVFLYRPSMAKPTMSHHDTVECFWSSSSVIELYLRMHARNSIDCTWMAIHWLYLACTVNLFCLWISEEIRSTADWGKINENIQSVTMILSAMVERWHWARACLRLYLKLAKGTLKRFCHITSASKETTEVERAMTGAPDAVMGDSYVFDLEDAFLDAELQNNMGLPTGPDLFDPHEHYGD